MTTLLARSIQTLRVDSAKAPAVRRAGRPAKGSPKSMVENLESRLLLSFTAGHLDPSFNPLNPAGFGKASGVLANGGFGTKVAEMEAATMLANGKILVAGITDVTGVQMQDLNAVPLVDNIGLDPLGNPLVVQPLYATQLTLARFNADGTLDTTFGTAGYVNWHTPDTIASDGVTHLVTSDTFDNNSLVVQADGKIVVAGAVAFADSTDGAAAANGEWTNTSDFLVARFNADGTLDDGTASDSTPSDKFHGNNNSIQTDGYVTTDYAQGYEVGRAVALQSDGKIVVTGYTQLSRLNPESFFFTTRYNTDGSLDTNFGEYGHALTSIGMINPNVGYGTQARSIMLQPDGKILVGGQARINGSRSNTTGLTHSVWDTSFVVARYNQDGSLDTSFGQTTASPAAIAPITYPATPGVQWVEATFGWYPVPPVKIIFDMGRDYVNAMTMDSNNNIYMTGYAQGGDFVSARLNSNGGLDTTWDGAAGGGLHTTINVSTDTSTDITVQADGRVIVSGISTMGADGQGANVGMVRYNADATIDTFFGTNGRVYTNSIGATMDIPRILLPTPDGKFVIVTDNFLAPPSTAAYNVLTNGLGSVGITGGPAQIGFFRYLNDQISADDVRPLPQLRNAAGTDRAPDVTVAGGTTYNFSVLLTDNVAISIASLGAAGNSADLYVTGPNGFNQPATFDSVDVNSDGQPRLAQFHFAAPGGMWDLTDTGIYTIQLRENAIWDTTNNSMPAGPLGQFAVSILTDHTKPTATAAGADVVAAGGTIYNFQVTYTDNVGIDLTTLGNGNILVTGPNNFSQLATYVGVDQPVNGAPRIATYSIIPPSGSWLPANQGTYRIFMQPNQVGDTAVLPAVLPVATPNYVDPGQIGSFLFAITDIVAPTASLNATNVAAPGGTTYTFSVTYSDNNAIDFATIKTGNVQITGPYGFTAVPTLVSIDAASNGTPRTATYSFVPPGGSWDVSDFGTYAISIAANQVADLAGNFIGGGPLGTFHLLFGSDIQPPTAVATAPDVTSLGLVGTIITVTYTDNSGIKYSTLDNNDIIVTGPNNYVGTAAFVSANIPTDGTPRTVIYQLAAPGGEWSPIHSGQYQISLAANQVTDIYGNAALPAQIGTFNVSIPGTEPAGVFGTNGFVSIAVGGASQTYANRVVRLNNGKFIVGGVTINSTNDFMLTQYLPNGTIDTSFGTNGFVVTDFGADEAVNGLAVQPDGKIVAVGGTTNNGLNISDVAVARYNPDGSLDPTFGVGGKVITDFNTGYELANSVIIQPDGKIVVAGITRLIANSPDSYLFLVRYQVNGSLDITFGNGGRTITDVPGTPANTAMSDEEGFDIQQQPDGKLVVVGQASNGGPSTWVTARYSPDGILDTATFGAGLGYVTGPLGSAARSAIQPDGKIVVTGYSPLGFETVRYNTDGTIDATFGNAGIALTQFSAGSTDIAQAVTLLNNGKILVVGTTTLQNNTDFALARYNADGTPDTSFGTNGKRITNFISSSDDSPHDVIILPDGRVYLAGRTGIKDAQNPVAYLNAPQTIKNGDTTYIFQVTFSDNSGIKLSTLGNNNIFVTGPLNYIDNATLLNVDFNNDGTPRVATYQIKGPNGVDIWPDGTWDTINNDSPPHLVNTSDSGTYTFYMKNQSVSDIYGNFVPGGAIGTVVFNNVTLPTQPTAVAISPDVPAVGVATYTFQVVYSAWNPDPYGVNANLKVGAPINVNTLDSQDVTVTGPNGFNQIAHLVSYNPVSSSTRVVATYRLTAPAGTWTPADLGTYTITQVASQVADTAGQFCPARQIGSFQLTAQGVANVGMVVYAPDGITSNDNIPPVAVVNAPNITRQAPRSISLRSLTSIMLP